MQNQTKRAIKKKIREQYHSVLAFIFIKVLVPSVVVYILACGLLIIFTSSLYVSAFYFYDLLRKKIVILKGETINVLLKKSTWTWIWVNGNLFFFSFHWCKWKSLNTLVFILGNRFNKNLKYKRIQILYKLMVSPLISS